jgi:C1A family cysteine protease
MVGVAVNDNFLLYSSGIFNGTCTSAINHGVVAVGFGSNFIKIKNSWSTSWGESGYIRLSRNGDGSGSSCVLLQVFNPL